MTHAMLVRKSLFLPIKRLEKSPCQRDTQFSKMSRQTSCDMQANTGPSMPPLFRNLIERSSKHLTDAEKSQLAQLLIDYQDDFANTSYDLRRCERVQHKINKRNALPVRQPARRLPLKLNKKRYRKRWKVVI